MDYRKIGLSGLFGMAVGGGVTVCLVPIIGGFGLAAMGGAVGTAAVAGISAAVGGLASAGAQAFHQKMEEIYGRPEYSHFPRAIIDSKL